MVFKKFSELENHLDVGEHSQVRGNSDTVYDKLRRDWEEKFRTVGLLQDFFFSIARTKRNFKVFQHVLEHSNAKCFKFLLL